MLHIRGLAKSYSGSRPRAVLRNIDLDLEAAQYVAIMGESGAGKSTLLNLIAGLDVADAGSISLDGVLLSSLDDTARTLMRRSHIGFVFQAFHLLPHLTVEQNVALPLALNGESRDTAHSRTMFMLNAVGLGPAASAYPRELSGGEMQRVAIARALVHRPKLVLADEPTGNLDADAAALVMDVLRQQIKSHSATGIVVTHSARAASTADQTLTLDATGLHGPAVHTKSSTEL